ncbi:MAG: site-2 protease family protein [Bdellovibrionales bacterium]|nr:site-2 protease family protein [Bdellovibrionales bacterium]
MDSSFAERIQMMTIQIVPFFMAIVLHEFGHGLVAKMWGDRTATDAGRLTLNPLAHVDPIGTVAIPMINMITGIPLLFGWAKPVPINPTRFRKYRPGLFWVSVAGPGTNIITGFLAALVFGVFYKYVTPEFSLYEPLLKMMVAGIQINFALALFNLLPLPPLDGAKILESFLGYNASQMLQQVERYSFFILIALLWSNALVFLNGPISFLTHLALGVSQAIFGFSFA